MTSYIIIIISIPLLLINLYMIKEGYDFTHVDEIMKRDGQYGMIYGFYGLTQLINFIIYIPLLIILVKRLKSQKLLFFRVALSFVIINPALITLGWILLD